MLAAAVLLLGLLAWRPSEAASLDASLLPGIQAATFEVVAEKPAEGGVRYEKPLPLDLLPYQERSDKYYSIGTAFSLGGGRYATAAHVLLSGFNSLWGQPALRDSAGKVHQIGDVHKFSLAEDFVVFSLARPIPDAPLPLREDATPGQAVYSVGNAYGTGIVVRDGLYTSDTPEEQDGRWKWMRFSAAASPGNSGGPLVDGSGRAVGVVLAKSPNENLNYALPIGRVLSAPEGKARIDTRFGYQFDVFSTTLSGTLDTGFDLPLPLPRFFAAYGERLNGFFDRQLAALLAKEPDRMFPNGEGSQRLLHSIPTMGNFPMVVGRNSNDAWALYGEAQNALPLSANGYIIPGSFGNNSLFHLRRPDDIPAAAFYGTPSKAIDLLLKTGFAKRQVGPENIAITSLGEPSQTARHTDRWKRHWRVWTFPMPYANGKLIVAALPVPNGYVGIARYSTAMQEHDLRINLVALTDFVYANFDGTLVQWREFLADPALRPDALRDVDIAFDYGKRLRYASDRLRVEYGPDLQAIGPDSVLTLGMAFYEDRGKPVWDVAQVWASADTTTSSYIAVVRKDVPPASLGEEFATEWSEIVGRKHPYDGSRRIANEATRVSSVAGPHAAESPKVLYTLHYSEQGEREAAAMAGKLELLKRGVQSLER